MFWNRWFAPRLPSGGGSDLGQGPFGIRLEEKKEKVVQVSLKHLLVPNGLYIWNVLDIFSASVYICTYWLQCILTPQHCFLFFSAGNISWCSSVKKGRLAVEGKIYENLCWEKESWIVVFRLCWSKKQLQSTKACMYSVCLRVCVCLYISLCSLCSGFICFLKDKPICLQTFVHQSPKNPRCWFVLCFRENLRIKYVLFHRCVSMSCPVLFLMM